MSHIALLHPQCVRVGGAVQMALQTTRALQKQGHTVTLYTFEKSETCFPELQKNIDIKVWKGAMKGERDKGNERFMMTYLCQKCFKIATLAWHCRHVDIIIANNPPMQIVAALAKVFSLKIQYKGRKGSSSTSSEGRNDENGGDHKKIHNYTLPIIHYSLGASSLQTVWWHHHVPWYSIPKNTAERINNKGGILIHLKSFFERFFIIPLIDEMIATSYYVADCVQQYCGRESVVIHPVIQPQSVGEYPRSRTTAQNREYPRSSTTPLKGGLDLELQTSAPFKGLLIPSEEKGSASENELSPSFKGVAGNAGGMVSIPEPDSYHQPIISSPLKGGLEKELLTNTVTLFTHGRLEPGKGIDTLVRVFQQIQNNQTEEGNGLNTQYGVPNTPIRLIVFGTGSLETELTKMGIEVRPFDREQTFRELSTGHYGHVLGVYCSTIDAFGMASLESQLAGLSTVILDSGGAREAILSDDYDEPVGYLVESEDHLSAIISRFVADKTLPKQMSNVNFSHTKDYFSPERLSSDLLSVITKTTI